MIAPDYATLWSWARERELIRMKKEVLGANPPWTEDPILREYRFCQVRREDDRVTRWIRSFIREPYADHPYLWLMLCIARAINWPDTLEELIVDGFWPDNERFDPTALGYALQERADHGEKVFTGAYVITAPQKKGALKTHFVAGRTIGQLWNDRAFFEPFPASLQKAHERLTRFDGWGPFMAYQVVIDLRYTRYLEGAPDRETWAAAGPGTVRGLNRIYGRKLDAPLSQGQALAQLRETWRAKPVDVEMDFNDVTGLYCEVDKYLRVKNGEGAPRARYVFGRGS